MNRVFTKILSFTLCFQLLVSCNSYSTSSSVLGTLFSPSSGFSITGTIASSVHFASEAILDSVMASTKIGVVSLSVLNENLEAEEIDRQDVYDDSMTFKFKNLNKEKIKAGLVLVQYTSDDGETRRSLIQTVDPSSTGEVVSVNPKTTFASDMQSALLDDIKNNSPADFNLEKIQSIINDFNLDDYSDVVDTVGGFEAYVNTYNKKEDALSNAWVFIKKDYATITDRMVQSPNSMKLDCKAENDISFNSKTKESRVLLYFLVDPHLRDLLGWPEEKIDMGEAYTVAEAEQLLKSIKDKLLFSANYNGQSIKGDLLFINKALGTESKCPLSINPGDPLVPNKAYFADFNPDQLKTYDEAKSLIEKIYNQTREELFSQYSLAGFDEKSPALAQQLAIIDGWLKTANELSQSSFSANNRVQLDLSLFDSIDFPSYESKELAKIDIENRFDKSFAFFQDTYNSYLPDQDFFDAQIIILKTAFEILTTKLEDYYGHLGPLKLNTTEIDHFDPSVYATEPLAEKNADKILGKAYDDMKKLNNLIQAPQEDWDAQLKIFEFKKDEIYTKVKEYFTKIAPLYPDFHQISGLAFSTFATLDEANIALKNANLEIAESVKTNFGIWELQDSQIFNDVINKLDNVTHDYAKIANDYFNLKLQPKVKEDFFLALNFANLNFDEARINLEKAYEQTKDDWYAQAALCPNILEMTKANFDQDLNALIVRYKELFITFYTEKSSNIQVDLSFIQNIDFSAIKNMDKARILTEAAYAKAKDKLWTDYKNAGSLNDSAVQIQAQLLVAERDKGLERANQVLFDKGKYLQINESFLSQLDFSGIFNLDQVLPKIEEATTRTYEDLEVKFHDVGGVNIEAYEAQKAKIPELRDQVIARARAFIENNRPKADLSLMQAVAFGPDMNTFKFNLDTAFQRTLNNLNTQYEMSGKVDAQNYEEQYALMKNLWYSRYDEAVAYFGK